MQASVKAAQRLLGRRIRAGRGSGRNDTVPKFSIRGPRATVRITTLLSIPGVPRLYPRHEVQLELDRERGRLRVTGDQGL